MTRPLFAVYLQRPKCITNLPAARLRLRIRRRCETSTCTHHNIIIVIITVKIQENQLRVFRTRCPRVRETIDSACLSDYIVSKRCRRLTGRWDDAVYTHNNNIIFDGAGHVRGDNCSDDYKTITLMYASAINTCNCSSNNNIINNIRQRRHLTIKAMSCLRWAHVYRIRYLRLATISYVCVCTACNVLYVYSSYFASRKNVINDGNRKFMCATPEHNKNGFARRRRRNSCCPFPPLFQRYRQPNGRATAPSNVYNSRGNYPGSECESTRLYIYNNK